MANTSQLQLTSLDFDTIKQNLITYLKGQTQFQDYNFEGSSLNILLDILAYNTFYNSFYMNMIANEMFLDSGILRQSVVSQAKLLGYTPRSATASQATLNVTITKSNTDPTTSLYIPRFTQFASQDLNGTTYSFYTVDDSVSVANSGNVFTFNGILVKEGTPVVKSYIVDNASNPSQQFDLVDQNIDLSTLQVTVQTSISNPSYNVFTLAEDATQVESDSNVFYLNEGTNANYILYFGDGILGKQLTDQNLITVSYLVTDADAANGLGTFFLQSTVLSGSTSAVTLSDPTAPSSGGSQIESVDSIKFAAPKSFISQNRIVTKNDYITQINKKYPYFDAVTVWGGEEQSPPEYGKVFVSAKPKGGFIVTQDQQNYLINQVLKPLSVLTVTAEYIPADYNYMNFSLDINYNPKKTTLSQQQLISAISNTVNNFVNSYLNTFNASFQYSKFLAAIDATDQSILSSSATLYIEKRFSPTLSESESYVIKYGTPLHRGISNDRLYSTPYLTVLDSNGTEQECYIEETPFSFGGIDGIEIQYSGSGYTTAPTISIEGDGIGANAYPVIVNGKITSVVIDNAGNNYTTAIVALSGGGNISTITPAQLIPKLTGQTGTLRMYYFDTNNVKQILNPTIGTIDYVNGIVYLNNLDPIDIGGSSEQLMIHAQPQDYNFSSSNEIILTYDPSDVGALTVTLNAVNS